jgi:group II intron reverse transcriptase/maturase
LFKKPRKQRKIRNNEYYNMQEKLDEIYRQSLNGKKFRNLMELITTEENIQLAFRNLKKNKGSKTKGTDGKAIDSIKEKHIKQYITYIQNKFKNYIPNTVRRVEIPKSNGKIRPLGIPTIADRIVQQCILQILEPICEAKFSNNSYGFRPNRNTENAVAKVMNNMQHKHMYYCIDIDIQGFFDNVNHGKLIKQIWTIGIQDKTLIKIISKILKSKIELPNGEVVINSKGTPQGGIISPLLSNIVLNERATRSHITA